MAKPVERDSNDLRHEEAAVNRAYGWELSLNSLDHYVPRKNLQPMKRARTPGCSYVVIGRLFGRVLTMEELIVATYVGHCLIDDEVTSINNKLKPGLTPVKDVLLGNYTKWEVFISHQKFAVDGWISLGKAIELMAERKITPDVRVLPRANSVGTVRKLVPLFELLGHQVKLLDSDGDGSIGISEIFSHVKETAVQGMDLDGDGKVGFTEVMMSLVNIIKDLPNFRQWETKLFHSSELAVLRLWGKSFLFLISMFFLFFYVLHEENPQQAILIDHCRLQARAQADVCKALLTEVAAAAAAAAD